MKTIEITEGFQIPGTEVILEAGDKICIKEYSDYDYARDQISVLTTAPFNFQIVDFEGNKTKWMKMDVGAMTALTDRFTQNGRDYLPF